MRDRLDVFNKHIKKNTVKAMPGRKCVDGRYEPGQEEGRIARPGADFGYVMILLALNKEKQLGLSPEECVDRMYDIVTKDGGTFFMHTDTHAHSPSIGCGHIAKACQEELASEYGLSAMDVKHALHYTQMRFKKGDSIHITTLTKDHEECAVLDVWGNQKTVRPYDPETGIMVFVYDRKRDTAFMRDVVVPQLHLPKGTFADFNRVSNKHLAVTLRLLAFGKPILKITV